MTHNEYKNKYEQILQKAEKKTEKSVLGFFIKNYRFTYLIIFFIVVMGFFSMFTIPREAEPEVEVPFAVVNTVYPGATPTDVEELVTNKIEDRIKNLENLKNFTSSSGQGFSSIFVEFFAEADLAESFRKLREAVDNAEPELPDEAELPAVTEINFNDFPIVTYSLVGDYGEIELKEFADLLQDEFESVRDVSRAPVLGGLEREFQIMVNRSQLSNYNLTLSQLTGAINASNFSLPAGNIEIDNFEYGVRVKGRFSGIDDLYDIVVTTYNGSPVYLRDVARIIDGFKERVTESKIGFPGQDSRITISLQVYKKTGGNILDIVDNTRTKIHELKQAGILPDDLAIIKTNDNSVFIKEDLKTLGTSGLQTVILITLILMVILSFRGALITAMSVPIAFLMAFIFLKLQGLTLNSMVLFSLVLSLGLMVDNAIVIIEGINEYAEKHKRSIYKAAILSVWNFKWPITAGTLTTVGAFLPMLLVSGILGEYISILPKTISVTLLSSLFVALIVIPTLASRLIKKIGNGGSSHRNKKRHYFIHNKMGVLYQKYADYMGGLLPDNKRRRRLIRYSWLAFIIALIIPASGLMKVELFPKIDLDYFFVNIKMPVGTVLEVTESKALEVEKIITRIPEMDNYVTNIGASASSGFAGDSGASGSYMAGITVNLVDKDERDRPSYEVSDELRQKLQNIQGAEITVEELSAGPPTGAPIEVRVFGEDLSRLSQIAAQVSNFLENREGVINVEDSLADSAGEFAFTVDKQKASFYGLNVASVASALRSAVFGVTATEVNLKGEDVDVTVKYDAGEFGQLEDLENLVIQTPTGQAIPLKQLAKSELEPSLLSIPHREGRKTVSITADIEAGTSLQTVLADFDEYKNTLGLPANYAVEVGGEVEDIEQSFTELFASMGLSVLLIATILILQFNSFRQPFIIIFTVPLAFIGVILGLNILRQPFSFTAFIGIVSLSGIVVNDAIVLIDRINKNINNGMEFIEAIVEGGLARIQPILLTTLTTVAGVFPLIFASELWVGLSISVIFGLIFATFLTLIMVPVFYAGMCRKEKCK